MKLMIASDIHGSLPCGEKLIERYRASRAQRLLLLGDLLYHGPRNDLPEGYNPKGVIALLNGVREELLCVRGNCEAEVDQMVLQFPVMAEYATLFLPEQKNRMIFITHGHHFNVECPPPLKEGDILLHGHTHIPVMEWQEGREGYLLLNPGSVSIPKGGSERSYMLYEDGIFTLHSLESGQELQRLEL